MAGIGIDFQSVCPERKLTVGISGFAYVALPAAAPMLLVAAALALMQRLNGYSEAAYDKRELFVCTVQYIFVFSLMTSSVVRPVLSACLFDAIYEKRLDNLFPAYSMGLLLSLLFAAVPGIPFCFREWAMGGVPAFYVFAGYCGYMLLNIVLVNTACLLDFHDYERVCAVFLFGLLSGIGVSVFLSRLCGLDVLFSILLSLDAAFLLIAALECTLLQRYCGGNSGDYPLFLRCCLKNWKLQLANLLYTLGACVHNFVFWFGERQTVIVGTFVRMKDYDMAAYAALLTTLSAGVITFARNRLYFEPYYRTFSQAITKAGGAELDQAVERMFRQMDREWKNLLWAQLCVTIPVCMAAIAAFTALEFADPILHIYPLLCVGYLLFFLASAAMNFLCFLTDMDGAVMTAAGFCFVTFALSVLSARLPDIWYGLGFTGGAAFAGAVASARLRWLKKHMDTRIFCVGGIVERGKGKRPSGCVFDRGAASARPHFRIKEARRPAADGNRNRKKCE